MSSPKQNNSVKLHHPRLMKRTEEKTYEECKSYRPTRSTMNFCLLDIEQPLYSQTQCLCGCVCLNNTKTRGNPSWMREKLIRPHAQLGRFWQQSSSVSVVNYLCHGQKSTQSFCAPSFKQETELCGLNNLDYNRDLDLQLHSVKKSMHSIPDRRFCYYVKKEF